MIDHGVTISIEVAYATPERQVVLAVDVPPGTTVEQAIEKSGICQQFPDIDPNIVKVGIFGHIVKRNQELREHDRVEIYRPLLADPKEVRRQLALEGKTMGRQSKHKSKDKSNDRPD